VNRERTSRGLLVAGWISLLVLCSASHAVERHADWPDPVAGEVLPYRTAGLTHGPVLGRPAATSATVWIRTRQPGEFKVVYDTHLPLSDASPQASGCTDADADNTGVVCLSDLQPSTRYYYGVLINDQLADLRLDFHDPWPSFRTLPDASCCADPANNPQQRFNLCFAIGHCASQDPFVSGGHYASPPVFDTLLDHHGEQIMFHILNGDTTYEELRDGTLDGIRANYKLYWSRGRSFARLTRTMASVFTYDDHEASGNLDGSGEVGLKAGSWLLRDPAVKIWNEYCGWANYASPRRAPIRFGQAELEKERDVLFDPQADFSTLTGETVSTIHVGPYAKPNKGVEPRAKNPKPKNAGVYALVEPIDKHRLRVRPAFRASERADYSIGSHHFFDWQLGNCHFFALDTRGERSRFVESKIHDADRFVLGDTQRRWLLEGVRNSAADFVFIISPDPWVIYHTAYHVNPERGATPKGDGFASYVHEREILLRELDRLNKPVLIFTGDVHNAIVAQITDNVWEFMCGPLSSTAHPRGTAGRMPMGGWWNSQGRAVKIKWIAGFPDNVHYERLRNTYYGIVRVNNVAASAKPVGPGYQWTAYDAPQVVVQIHDGYTGELMYAEGISTADLRVPPSGG
jgi:phosphodiesterase/alkaline phosphatase D-like protein